MQIAQAGVPFPFEYAAYDYATDLIVRASIRRFNSNTNAWDFITAMDMPHVGNGQYAGEMTGEDGYMYLIQKLVYTDVSHTVLDPNRSQGSEGVQCLDLAGGGGGGGPAIILSSTAADLIGVVDTLNELVGQIDECMD